MSDLFKKAISLGWGLTIVSKEKVEKIVDDLVKRGELAPSESKELVNRLVERGEEEQSQFKTWIQDQVRRVLTDIHVPSDQDIVSLEQRIATLEKRVAELEAERSGPAAE
ncbi:polyhydroxyalkanoate synthesis regulator [Paenibacillus favisporus]|uniref:phasin family protein n=1 Tax=Paenibacillus TaxID=44249 RepID=UPI0011AB49ED|nr:MULTISPECIES: polyhydroxyalkanoate synthesis regulator [Paenibacillus]MEC0175549.1 polyhydroxyalkanoate synthesis regulator [Paenibacillus favisporus]